MRRRLYDILNIFQPLFKSYFSNRLRVLAYHKVPDQEVFEEQLQYLIGNYNLLSIEDLQLFFQKKRSLPPKPVLITFDDGDVSVLENGLPVLQKFKVPSCLFVITGLLNSDRGVWIKKVEEGEIAEGKSYREARKKVNYLKKIDNKKRLEEMKRYEEVSCRQLTTAQLKILQGSGMFIANHSHSHPMFDRCSQEEIQEEIRNSKEVFDSLDLNGFSVFAYPNGNADELSQKLLQNSGMEMIFLFDHKVNPKNINPFSISRIRVDTNTEIREFKTKVSGLHPQIFKLKNRF